MCGWNSWLVSWFVTSTVHGTAFQRSLKLIVFSYNNRKSYPSKTSHMFPTATDITMVITSYFTSENTSGSSSQNSPQTLQQRPVWQPGCANTLPFSHICWSHPVVLCSQHIWKYTKGTSNLQGLKLQGLQSSGMWHYIKGWVDPKVSNKLLHHWWWNSTFLWNTTNHSPSYTALHLRTNFLQTLTKFRIILYSSIDLSTDFLFWIYFNPK